MSPRPARGAVTSWWSRAASTPTSRVPGWRRPPPALPLLPREPDRETRTPKSAHPGDAACVPNSLLSYALPRLAVHQDRRSPAPDRVRGFLAHCIGEVLAAPEAPVEADAAG